MASSLLSQEIKILKSSLKSPSRAYLSSRRPHSPRPSSAYQSPPSQPPPPPPPTPQPSVAQKSENSSTQLQDQVSSPKISVVDALRNIDATNNDLLTPVYIPEDPDGVLNEKHPATTILANSSIIIERQLEMMNVLLGFEQANKYVILDPQGNHVGFIAEQDLGIGKTMARQMFRTHRSFTTHVFDKYEKEFHRPFAWISSRIGIYDPLNGASGSQSSSKAASNVGTSGTPLETNRSQPQSSRLALSEMRIIGEAQQQWAPLRRKYNLFLFRQSPNPGTDLGTHNVPLKSFALSSSQQLQVSQSSQGSDQGRYGQFAFVDEPFLSFDFSLLSANSQLIGSVNRNFTKFGREIFTDTGVYALRMDAARLASEPQHQKSTSAERSETAYKKPYLGMTLDQRAVMLATAVSIDFDYFSRKRGFGGLMPIWFPSSAGAGEAAGGVAGAGAAGEAGAGALGGVAKGAGGLGEGAAVGAGSAAGYEAMRRGVYDGDASTVSDQGPASGENASPQDIPPDGEVWGNDHDPWSSGQGEYGDSNLGGSDGWGDGGGSGGGGGGVGGGGGGEGGSGFWNWIYNAFFD